MEFVAFDFETANSTRSSVCALGIAQVEGRAITKCLSRIIRPPTLCFHPYNTYLHGITAEDVKDKPEFYQLWDEFRQYFQNKLLIAHNANFDISVLCCILDEYGIPYPTLRYLCTCTIARRTWPNLPNYKLNTVSKYLGIEFRHHDAQEDAIACAGIAICACKEFGVNSLEELARKINIRTALLHPVTDKPGTIPQQI
jgi:DNA polymerase-3 subunit epsilon